MVFILNEGICFFNIIMNIMGEYDNNDISLVKDLIFSVDWELFFLY